MVKPGFNIIEAIYPVDGNKVLTTSYFNI